MGFLLPMFGGKDMTPLRRHYVIVQSGGATLTILSKVSRLNSVDLHKLAHDIECHYDEYKQRSGLDPGYDQFIVEQYPSFLESHGLRAHELSGDGGLIECAHRLNSPFEEAVEHAPFQILKINPKSICMRELDKKQSRARGVALGFVQSACVEGLAKAFDVDSVEIDCNARTVKCTRGEIAFSGSSEPQVSGDDDFKIRWQQLGPLAQIMLESCFKLAEIPEEEREFKRLNRLGYECGETLFQLC